VRRDERHFRLSESVRAEGHIGARENADGSSQSGHERDHLFLSDDCGRQFEDVSFVSGLDDPGDGRSFALWDFNQDGWQDLAVINANHPKTQIYRNDIGTLPDAEPNHGIAVRLVGGNRSATASREWSSRDAIGARIQVDAGHRRISRYMGAGEGKAAQNSATLLIGLGGADRVDRLQVLWPSGRTSTLEGFASDQLVTLFENVEENATTMVRYGGDNPPTP